MTKTVTQPEVSHYTYRVMWSAEDNEFVATCVEFPGLSWLDPNQMDALHGIEALVVEVVADLIAEHEPVPAPIAESHYSGKLNLRLGPDLHRRVALAAAERGLSINTYLIHKVST